MTDTFTHLGVRQLWKSLREPKTVNIVHENWSESARTASIDDRHVNAPQGSTTIEIALGPQNGE